MLNHNHLYLKDSLGNDYTEYCNLVIKLASKINILPDNLKCDEKGNLIGNNQNLTKLDVDVLYEKAGRIAYLFGLINFSSDNALHLFTDDDDKNIKYSVVLLANYQQSIDNLMDSDIQGLVYTGTNQKTEMNEYKNDAENSFSVSDLNEVDRKFINLEYYNSTPTKQDVIDRLKGTNTTKPIPHKIEIAIMAADNDKKDKMAKKWETLKYEEIETRKFLNARDTINSKQTESEKLKVFREAYMPF